ncbi:MAG: alpha/beta fold hydrolase, partial [bacterium]
MADHIHGPLYYERVGRTGHVMLFIHPNPMDQSSWAYQLAHLSTWYRCIAVDLPGYGRSPVADAGLTLSDMAQASWEALDDVFDREPAIIVGCSTGARIAIEMYHQRPSRTLALILSGTGFIPNGNSAWADRVATRIAQYRELGAAYRWQYTLEDFSPEFRTTPLAQFFAQLFSERNEHADVDSIIRQFEAISQPLDDGF